MFLKAIHFLPNWTRFETGIKLFSFPFRWWRSGQGTGILVSSIGDNDHPEAVQFFKLALPSSMPFSFTTLHHSIHLSIYLYVGRVPFNRPVSRGIETISRRNWTETRPLISSNCYSNSLDSRLWSDVFVSFRDFACFYGLRNSGWMEFIFRDRDLVD